jgi:hypothetical protein
MRVLRERVDYASRNPHFTFHALVTIGSSVGAETELYDPSYGDYYDLASSAFDETVADPGLPTAYASDAAARSHLLIHTVWSEHTAVVVTETECLHFVDAAFVSHVVPSTVSAGTMFLVTIELRNTGKATWSLGPAGIPDFVLLSINPIANMTWGATAVILPHSVAPGETVAISWSPLAPSSSGVFSFQWRCSYLGCSCSEMPRSMCL